MFYSPPLFPSFNKIITLLAFFLTRSADSTFSTSAVCPSPCHDGVANGGNWCAFHDINQLSMCDKPVLLDFNVHNAFNNPDTHTSIFACSTNLASSVFARDTTCNETNTCGIPLTHNTKSRFNIIRSGSSNSANSSTTIDALRIVQHELSRQNTPCKSTMSFIIVGNSVVGVFAGASVPLKPFSEQVLERVVADIKDHGAADRVYIESCNGFLGTSNLTMGVVIGNFTTLPLVQSAVSAWAHGGCMTTKSTANSTAMPWQSFNLPLLSYPLVASNESTGYHYPPRGRSRISRRSDCSTVQVNSGDSCASLAEECGISAADFTKYNSKSSLCSTLTPGQHVCCSAGSLPDFAPKPQADGTCATHTVVSDDTCTGIATANSITVANIGKWNSQTWQFMGCSNLQIGQIICISTGDPPMPAPVKNAVCGPQVPGTHKPDNMSFPGALASLNQCPLKVCCNIWGQCGNTADFCTISNARSQAPGTAAPGQNGCISNCGTDIVSSIPPPRPITVAYFEGFNEERPCLNMDASEIPVDSHSHLHFSFASISESFDVQMEGAIADQWHQFRTLSGPSLILSFGGWAFSTDPKTYSVLRNAVKKENRATFAKNVASFVSSAGIDGVDFDWEYPGAPDIPGIPPGDPEDGPNYLAFLKELRNVLPSGKSISIAAPASYWYLKAFPIAEISKVVSYIVYMTYDLHGQWDYGNAYSDPGCPKGNCLRSDVNSTETHTALSMITKAGVPSNKVVVGITSYGRSFQMTESGCTGPMCTYTGPNSGATPGRCTQTAGYLAQAEIDEILEKDGSAHTFYDNSSESDIMVYNKTQWVSYMSHNTKVARSATYLKWNFLGTVDWAIDLEAYTEAEQQAMEPFPACNNAENYHTVDDVAADSSIPDFCVNMYLMNAVSKTLSTSLQSYADIMANGYDGKYKAYEREVRGQGYWAWQKVWDEHQDTYFTCLQTEGDNNKTVSCGGTPSGSAYYYVIKDKTKFCHDLDSKYSLECSWITWTSTPYHDPGAGGSACERGICPVDGKMYWPNLNDNFAVFDPSALITKSLRNYTRFSDWLDASAQAAQVYMFPPLDGDAVDASSTMVFSVHSAVQAMQQVADVGAKAEAEQRKDMIIAFITAFLLIVPGIGEAADGVEALAAVVRIAKLVDVVGNSAMSIYGAVENPDSAPMAVASILLGGLALRDESAWGKAAAKSRTMSNDMIQSLGKGVSTNLGKLKQTCKECEP